MADEKDRATSWPTTELDATDDARLVAALRSGDEAAFEVLLARYHASMVRVAILYVRDQAVAEEVVQETWIGLLQGIDRFEGRSALRTWLFRILTNQAKARAAREDRTIAFSALGPRLTEPADPSIEPSRFFPPGHEYAGDWITPIRPWEGVPEAFILASETRTQIRDAIAGLPPAQQAVITLRDIDGFTAPDVCHMLGVSATNQRVLLHRARTSVRRRLEQDFGRAH